MNTLGDERLSEMLIRGIKELIQTSDHWAKAEHARGSTQKQEQELCKANMTVVFT